MVEFEHALLLLLLVAALSLVGKRLPWPELITYLGGGIAVAFIPHAPRFALDPGFFFVCFLPPLLFGDGWLMPLREFLKAKRPILLLAVGLVICTTLAVGLVAHALVPGLPLPMAFALGAIISPTDAVAVSAVTQRLTVPARLTTVLSGESLMNDATGLVGFKFALAAVVAGTFSLRQVAGSFAILSAGGLFAGLAISYAVGRLRDLLRTLHVSDDLLETTLSLLTPYAAYLLAESVHVSGVLSVVAAGLYAGWRDPVRMDAAARQNSFAVWSLVIFLLNGVAFVLLGLQFPTLLSAVSRQFTAWQLAGLTAAVAGTAILTRLAWVFPAGILPFCLKSVRLHEKRVPLRNILVVGWAGMRGTVTLAAALSIPLSLPDGSPFPGRDIVIFLAFGVIASTLILQGSTLEWVIRRLGIHGDENRPKEERLARMTAVKAGLGTLRALEESAVTPEENAALRSSIAEYEQRLAVLTAEGETRRRAHSRRTAGHRYQFLAIKAERGALDELWRSGAIIDEVHRPLQQLLDHEESMLVALEPGVTASG